MPIGAADLSGCGMWTQEFWTSIGNFRKTKNTLPVRGALEDLNCITASARSFYNMWHESACPYFSWEVCDYVFLMVLVFDVRF